jgi:hypothetical protein
MVENSILPTDQVIPEVDSVATWSVRFVDPSGFECQLSLEAGSGIDVLKKAQLALERLLEINCTPAIRTASNPTAKDQENGKESFCPIHKVEMKLWKKNGRSWYSHKVDGSWCKGE